MRDRLPEVARCLRDGLIAPKHIHTVVTRTDLVDGRSYAADVDAEIADALRRRGSWSDHRMRDMIDRIVHRHDPDAVRERRVRAKDDRTFWTENAPDGMAQVGATMAAEDAMLVAARVEALATRVCRKDPRTKNARSSDALFALATATTFECQCSDPACPVEPSDPSRDEGVSTTVVADSATLDDQNGAPSRSGFLAGYGIISPDHVRDLAARVDAVRRSVRTDEDACHAVDPHRPTAAMETFVRIRDQYCVWPGCNAPAWTGDIDHVAEYDHEHPARGGGTSAVNLNGKCRFHHNLKTFGNFVDDQHSDDTGRIISTVATPEGVVVDGPAHNGYDTHPGLSDVTFRERQKEPPRVEPLRKRTRVAAKHARRRVERARNRRAREAIEDGPPPF